MNRIDSLFGQKKKNVLAIYFTAGYPELNDTAPTLAALQQAGADLVEIGMPFSDPLADGPVIQESSKTALQNGMNISLLFDQLKNFREKISLPVVLMGYVNPVMQFGVEEFAAKCSETGIDGVILPDLPPEIYEQEFRAVFEKHGLHFIFLVTPRTPEQRVWHLAGLSKGFLYLVSSAGTTGGTGKFSVERENALRIVSGYDLKIPVLTGFGIHDHGSFLSATKYTNGAVVGSAFIRELAISESTEAAARKIVSVRSPETIHHP